MRKASKHKPTFRVPDAPNLQYEHELAASNFSLVAGLDEAGRGAWAGPVSAAAVILKLDENTLSQLAGVRDSKQMTARQREYWAVEIKKYALAWAVGFAENDEIDNLGIINATRTAMLRALSLLRMTPDYLLIDALLLPKETIPQTALIKGDQRSLSIAAASVLAKTTRDQRMCKEAQVYPAYGFAAHKGYGTRHHQESLAEFGACPLHRMSFKPLKADVV